MGIKKRAAKLSNYREAAQQEFLYTDYYSDYDGAPGSTRHRVVKKTARRVFIERRCDSWREDGETYYDVQTIALDREELEREGCVYSRRGHDLFHTSPHDSRHVAYEPPCLAFLGVDQPCTAEKVDKAYRRLAMKLHPDHGGDAESFKGLQLAYEEALRLLA